MSANGDTLAVGAPSESSKGVGVNGDDEDNNSVDESGAAYIFTRVDSKWEQQAYVKASTTDKGDFFGTTIALSGTGDRLAVGAIGQKGDNDSQPAGAVYLFERTGDLWSQHDFIKSSNIEKFDLFGSSLALSAGGDTLVVGAVGEDGSGLGVGSAQDDGTPGSGAVYLFSRSNGMWAQDRYIKAPHSLQDGFMSNSLDLSDDAKTLAVGAIGEGTATFGVSDEPVIYEAPWSGAVYLY